MEFPLWDSDDEGMAYPISDNMAMDSPGDFLLRLSDTLSMNMDSGEIHITSSWDDDD